jgi:copper transport protein
VERSRTGLVAAAAAAVFLLAAGPASAHAFLTRSEPAPGAVVTSPPTEVRLFFDEAVKPAKTLVSRGGGPSAVAGKPFVPAGHPNEIVIPLRHDLGSGPYAVNWSEIDAEDGHVISGAFVFAIRSGLPPGPSISSQSSSNPPFSAVASRWLLLVGLLVAAGSVAFALVIRRARSVADSFVLSVALAVATLGAVLSVVLEPGQSGTRFGHWMTIGAVVAGLATACALASLRVPLLWAPAGVLAVLLLGLPTATGHAAAAGASHWLSIPADLMHLAAAAFWIGGVVQLGLVWRRGEPGVLRDLVRRFMPFALGAVSLLGASGVARAFNELSAVHQLWTTGYGQALLVKTGLLAAVLVLAALFSRRAIGVELVLLAVVIGAVAVLTNLRPGRAEAKSTAPTASNTVVYAGQDDQLAVGVAVTPKGGDAVGVRATVIGFKGPAAGLDLRFGVDDRSTPARACGAGCYEATVPVSGKPRSFTVRIGSPAATLRFAAPAEWPAPDGLEIVRQAERAISGLHSLVVHSRLASDANHEVTTVYKMVAPDRIAYRNIGGGESVIIGTRRWDKAPGAGWVKSQQLPPLQQPAPFWGPNVTDAHVLRTAHVDGRSVWVVSFADPSTPAWFTAWIDRSTQRTLRLDMVAVAHFMHDRDGPFNAPISVDAPVTSR